MTIDFLNRQSGHSLFLSIILIGKGFINIGALNNLMMTRTERRKQNITMLTNAENNIPASRKSATVKYDNVMNAIVRMIENKLGLNTQKRKA